MTIEQFWSATWKDVQIYLLAYERREIQAMRRTRAIAHMIYSAHSKNPLAADKFWPLPGDPQPEKREPLTDEQLAKIFSIYK